MSESSVRSWVYRHHLVAGEAGMIDAANKYNRAFLVKKNADFLKVDSDKIKSEEDLETTDDADDGGYSEARFLKARIQKTELDVKIQSDKLVSKEGMGVILFSYLHELNLQMVNYANSVADNIIASVKAARPRAEIVKEINRAYAALIVSTKKKIGKLLDEDVRRRELFVDCDSKRYNAFEAWERDANKKR